MVKVNCIPALTAAAAGENVSLGENLSPLSIPRRRQSRLSHSSSFSDGDSDEKEETEST
jgi:hypothetical protein